MNTSIKNRSLNIVSLLWLILLLTVGANAQQFDPDELLKPRTGRQTLVNDFAAVLTPDQKQALEEKLVLLDDSTSTQVAVVIVPTTGSYSISEYNQQLGRAWGVGDKRYNNGVVLLIAKADRKLDIAVGYGLEGALTDYTAKQIIDDVIVPRFKGNDYYGGIDDGINAIVAAIKGEYHAPRDRSNHKTSLFEILVVIILIIVFLALISKGGGGGTFMSRRGSRPIIWPTGGGSNWGGGGSGWSGGGSSGGFGGFGGGSFGGGGASGSW